MLTISSTTGTYLGDSNGIFLDEDTTIDVNNLTIEGTFSYFGSVYPILFTYSMPAPDVALITYISIQINATGTVTAYPSTSALPTLQTGNVLIIFSETIPANAVNDMAFTTEAEPVLDEYVMD